MRLLLSLAFVLATAAHAQGVTQANVTPDDLLWLYDRAVAVEVPIPEGATRLTFSLTGTSNTTGHNISVPPGATSMRVIALLPDPSVVDPCSAEEAEARIVVIPMTPSGASFHSSLKACVPHPPKSQITGESRRVLAGVAGNP